MNLLEASRVSLEKNIVSLSSGDYLAAGQRQFASLWTRDFCIASRGLLAIQRFDVVKNHLTALLRARRKIDHLVPRSLDSIATQRRVLQVSASTLTRGLIPMPPPLRDPLLPEYATENGTETIDANALLVIAAADYVRRSGDQPWWSEWRGAVDEVYHYYDDKLKDGLIEQPAFSDWQDSARREGKTFYANLIYWAAARALGRADNELKERIHAAFFDPVTQLYRTQIGYSQVSIDGNLLALDWDFATPGLYDALKKSALWRGAAEIPGFVTHPDYPTQDISWTTRIAGLRHYHDRLYWSWLMGLALKCSKRFADVETRKAIETALDRAIARDGAISEVYANEPGLPQWRSASLRSECPFSWGAAFVLDALA